MSNVQLQEEVVYINVDRYNKGTEDVPQEQNVRTQTKLFDDKYKYQIAVYRGLIDLSRLPLAKKSFLSPMVIEYKRDDTTIHTANVLDFLPDVITSLSTFIFALNDAIDDVMGPSDSGVSFYYNYDKDKLILEVSDFTRLSRMYFDDSIKNIYFNGFAVESGKFVLEKCIPHDAGEYIAEYSCAPKMFYYDTIYVKSTDLPIIKEYSTSLDDTGQIAGNDEFLFDTLINPSDVFSLRGSVPLYPSTIRWVNIISPGDMNSFNLSLWAKSKTGVLERLMLSQDSHFQLKLGIRKNGTIE